MTPRAVPGVVLRRAVRGDEEAVVETRLRMFEDMGIADEAALEEMARRFRASLGGELRTGAYVGWLAEMDGRVIGGVGIVEDVHPSSPRNLSGRIAYVLNVWVDPGWRRQGLATQLVETAVSWAREAGFGIVALHASEEGRHVYPRLGFQPSNEMRLFLEDLER